MKLEREETYEMVREMIMELDEKQKERVRANEDGREAESVELNISSPSHPPLSLSLSPPPRPPAQEPAQTKATHDVVLFENMVLLMIPLNQLSDLVPRIQTGSRPEGKDQRTGRDGRSGGGRHGYGSVEGWDG